MFCQNLWGHKLMGLIKAGLLISFQAVMTLKKLPIVYLTASSLKIYMYYSACKVQVPLENISKIWSELIEV